MPTNSVDRAEIDTLLSVSRTVLNRPNVERPNRPSGEVHLQVL